MAILNLIHDLKLKLKSQFLLCCHCNVNSLYTHNKLSMLEAYNIAHKYDLSLKGYIILLTQTILMMLREEVFVCTKRKTYPLGLSALLTSINVYYVKWESEKLLCENQKSYIGIIYHSPSQSCNEFEDFLLNLEKLINQIKQLKPSITIIFGDFNARYSDSWAHDITSTEDTHINSLISMYGFDE